MSRWLNKLQPWGVVLLRLVLGFSIVYHSWDKVYPKGGFHSGNYLSSLEYFNEFVAHLGLPRWLGYVSTVTEFFGGLCVLLGLLTRFWALMIAGNMVVAIATVNIHRGYPGSEYSIALLALATMILLTGPGRAALDRRLGFS